MIIIKKSELKLVTYSFFLAHNLGSVFDAALCDIPTQAFLATRVEVGRRIAQVTYALEGDGPMIFVAKDIIQVMMDSLGKYVSGNFELEEETTKRIALFTAVQDRVKALVREVAISALNYMNLQFHQKHVNAWAVLTHASALCPWNANSPSLTNFINYLQSILLITPEEAKDLMNEVPTLVEIAAGRLFSFSLLTSLPIFSNLYLRLPCAYHQ
jgi:hypothetical protein